MSEPVYIGVDLSSQPNLMVGQVLISREALAALPEVQALIAEAEKAADAVDMAYGDPHDEETPHRYSAKLRAAIAAIRKRGEG